MHGSFIVREVTAAEDIEQVRRLVRAHGDARVTTPVDTRFFELPLVPRKAQTAER